MSMNHPHVMRTTAALLLFSVAFGAPSVFAKDQEEDTTVRIYKKVAPTTVFVASAYFTRHSMTRASSNGIGSGVLINDQGEIVTNAHVMDGAAKIMVLLHDGTRLPAEVVGIDGETDIALLRVKLPEDSPPFAQFGDSDSVEVGQTVLAIGHPFGLGYALTTGVVSGFGTSPIFGLEQEAVLQTSAAINPGNSGGPLVNLEGNVIGLNASILMGAQNIGFAIPINTVKSIVAELRSNGRVIRPWLGIKATLLSEEVINLFTLPLASGWLVEDIEEGSPAEKAGLLAGDLNVTIEGVPWVLGGDIIQEINGESITTAEQHAETLKKLKVGDDVELSILREGTSHKILATVQERPRAQALSSKAKGQEETSGPPIKHQAGEAKTTSRKIRF
ncbi:MAG TPA: trypsin-like peptidase domain-containing protein [Nitrospirales bacterium]